MEAFPRHFLALLFDQASSYQVNEASNQLVPSSLLSYNPSLGKYWSPSNEKGTKKKEKEKGGGRERGLQIFLRRRKLAFGQMVVSRFGERNQGKF